MGVGGDPLLLGGRLDLLYSHRRCAHGSRPFLLLSGARGLNFKPPETRLLVTAAESKIPVPKFPSEARAAFAV